MRSKNSSFRVRFPLGLFVYAMLLCLIGVVNIFSAAKATQPNLYIYQLIWLGIAVTLGVVIVFVQTRTLEWVAYPFYIAVMGLLLGVLVFGIVAKGGQRWIDLGFMRLQPSELAKIAAVLATARYCTNFQMAGGYGLLDILRPLNPSRPLALIGVAIGVIKKFPEYRIAAILLILLAVGWLFLSIQVIMREGFRLERWVALGDVMLVPFLLIAVEPDLATGTIVLAISGTMVLFCGVRTFSLVLIGVVAISAAVIGWNFFLHDYQKHRVYTFLDPDADVRGKGYQAMQSIIAVGSGQFLGKGYGEGTQTQLSFLPENHTDFVFSVLAEEWGFVGAFGVLALFLALILSMLRIATKAHDRFATLLVVGATSVIFWHWLVNVGMVIGLLPVAGVPLPFVSYGGASMLIQIAALSICINVAIWRKVK
ncbi:MAG: rod shape-determining protein RodA [Myxococcaceae bacterium]|nr:rod shape-determining protein RodA [Myxococcaceae bacterium]MBH2006506.1 rod shape-determining protein RodA [Myxococcaceae bacterium]